MSTMGVVLVGISIVFLCMIIITLILSAFPFLMGSGKKKQKAAKKPSVDPAPAVSVSQPAAEAVTDNGELIAVITAAVAAYLGDSQGNGFRVVSFKRIGDNAPVWAKTGRLENLTE